MASGTAQYLTAFFTTLLILPSSCVEADRETLSSSGPNEALVS